MKKSGCVRLLILFQIMLLITGCGKDPWHNDTDYYIVEMTGVELAYLPSNTWVDYASLLTEEDDTLSIAVSRGDLIGISTLDEAGVYFRYDPDDGLLLSFSGDTSGDVVYLNNEVFSLDLSGRSGAWACIEQGEAGEFGNLRSITVGKPLSKTQLELLRKIADVNPNPGILVDNDTSAQQVLSIFLPEWMALEGVDLNHLTENIKPNLGDLELAWIMEYDSGCMEFLYELPKLNSLIVNDADSAGFSEIRFGKLAGLRSLSFVESEIHDLASFDVLQQLNDLNLVYCDLYGELDALAGITGLNSFGLPGCELDEDISVIENFPSLTRLSLPPYVTNEEFAGILEKQNSMQVLELIYWEDTLDLGLLAGYPGLKALSIGSGITDLTPLYQLPDLKLLVLDIEYYEDTTGMIEMKNALPGTRIVAGGVFCLGSGWILLVIPLILLLVLFKSRYNKYNLPGSKR